MYKLYSCILYIGTKVDLPPEKSINPDAININDRCCYIYIYI